MTNKYSSGGGQLPNNSSNLCKIKRILKYDFFSNIIFKDVKEFNIIFLILIGIFLVSISGYSSYAIFTDEIVSNNEIKGVVKVGNLDSSGANTPMLANNMLPVYYDESDNNWKKADRENKNKNYKWYDYNSKMWANAVTLYSDGGYKYKSKVATNQTLNINGKSCDLDVPTLNYNGSDLEFNIDYNNNTFWTSYKGEPLNNYYLLSSLVLINLYDYNFECGFDYANNTLGNLQSLYENENYTIMDYYNEFGFLIFTYGDIIYYVEAVEERSENVFIISPIYLLEESTTYTNYLLGSDFSFNDELGEYNLSSTSNSTLTSSAVGKYMCDNNRSSCSKMYKINTVSDYSATNVDVYETEKIKTQVNELTLADGSKKSCSSSICTREDYINAPNGTVIPMTDINAMFVWIPRYKYTYFSSATPVEIPITFESGTSRTGTIKCTDAIAANSGKSENCTDTTNGSITVGTSTYTHPAFTFGNKELSGIWVGKFENSGGNNITIKPDVQSTRNIYLSTMFQYARNMELANNIYGFPQSGTTLNAYTGEISGDSNNLDTHMMKNMEWGVVAYLSHSKYGMNSDVYINNSSDSYTGRSGGNVGGSTSVKKEYTDQTSTTSYNNYGFYTYDGYLLNYNTNTKSITRNLSKVASTTGNIYGIYDMSGGSSEDVMGNMQDSSNAFYPKSAGTWSSTNKPLDKYYDKYSYGTSEKEYTKGKLGDATIELGPDGANHSVWYGNFMYVPYSSYPWFLRGGPYHHGNSGLFYSGRYGSGSSSGSSSSRTVLSIVSF